ncbi:hypothetical protein BKA62DRAFT_189314 [Auriculariales sp. MPI-PUGE-AT-0066]|nr:hypothetical protein BKA62DRAFT_189314 [Auriculariales sp. MPI-PUGE-AT-0066]
MTPDHASQDLQSQVPSRDEIARLYPPRWSFLELKLFIDSGDLGLLKRDPALQQRYDAWLDLVRVAHGTVSAYLVNIRLGWAAAPPAPPGVFFTVDSPRELWKILQNDWPYCIPHDVEHALVWTRVPIVNAERIPPAVRARIDDCGLWGFTGGADAELIRTDGTDDDDRGAKYIGTGEEARAVRAAIRVAGTDVDAFVRTHWPEDEWETAWFVNPPRLQSIPGLAHTHVFARRKTTPVQPLTPYRPFQFISVVCAITDLQTRRVVSKFRCMLSRSIPIRQSRQTIPGVSASRDYL